VQGRVTANGVHISGLRRKGQMKGGVWETSQSSWGKQTRVPPKRKSLRKIKGREHAEKKGERSQLGRNGASHGGKANPKEKVGKTIKRNDLTPEDEEEGFSPGMGARGKKKHFRQGKGVCARRSCVR